MNAVTQTEAAEMARNFTRRYPAAIFPDEVAQECREEAALCNMDSLADFLHADKPAFKHRYWLSTAVDIERDYLNAKKYPTEELAALMFMAAKPAVVMACRDEVKERYLKAQGILA